MTPRNPLPFMLGQNNSRPDIDPDVMTAGTIIVPVRDDLARYNQFSFSLAAMAKPEGTRLVVSTGLNVVQSLNDTIERDFAGAWCLLLGDDHILPVWLIPILLGWQKDIVGCVNFTRRAPFHWCLFKEPPDDQPGRWPLYGDDDLPSTGCVPVGAVGSAGLMISAAVIEAILDHRGYVFSNTSATSINEDLEFCQVARELGYQTHCDMSLRLGHLGTMFTAAHWDEEQGWGVTIEFPGGHGRVFIPGVDQRALFTPADPEPVLA